MARNTFRNVLGAGLLLVLAIVTFPVLIRGIGTEAFEQVRAVAARSLFRTSLLLELPSIGWHLFAPGSSRSGSTGS